MTLVVSDVAPAQDNAPAARGLPYRLTGARPGELGAALWSALYFFSLLAGYYVLRPIRDEMANQIGRDALAELFGHVFFSMLALAPLFGWLTARVPRKRLLPWLYAFCVLNLLGFWGWMEAGGGTQAALTARVFYVWVSVFNLFVVSLFWSFMADLFATDQAKRLYGFIAAGGTLGGLAGPLIAASFVGALGPKHLMLVSAGLLAVAIVCILRLRAWERAQAQHAGAQARAREAAEEQPIGGSIWAGLRDIATSPYLLGICGFLLCYSLLSTLMYYQQVELLPAAIPEPARRTQLLARVDFAVNALVLLVQLLAFGALMRRLGTRFMLLAMPVLSVLGFIALVASPMLATLLAFGVVRRAGEYAISKPARETLFNALPAEQKYKAKNAIDTLVHRSGDWLSTLVFSALGRHGWSGMQMSAGAVPLALAWAAVAWWLGGQARRKELAAADAADASGGTAAPTLAR